MKIGTQVVLNKSYRKIILKTSWLPWYYADVNKKLKNKQKQILFSNGSYFWSKKDQFCFDILKDKRIIFNINSGFYIGKNIQPGIARQKWQKSFFSFLARHYYFMTSSWKMPTSADICWHKEYMFQVWS